MPRPSHTERRAAAHDTGYCHTLEPIRVSQSTRYTDSPFRGKESLDSRSDSDSDCCPRPEQRPNLSRTLYQGSAGRPQVVLSPCGSQEEVYMEHQYVYSTTKEHQPPTWNVDPSFSSPEQSSSQHTFPVSQSSTLSANNRITNKPSKKQGATKRLTVQDFQLLLQAPAHHYELLRQYVGADSRYTLAATHAGIFVRTSARSPDLPSRLKEATTALTYVRDFVRFVHSIPKDDLKSEQKGCLALRVSYTSLTALLGDFSGDMDIHAGDPQAPIVSRHDLPTFRRSFPQVTQIMVELSAELENSVKTYKHRRSPSPSVVIKLRAMLKTLAVWNDYLRDSTFAEPTKTIQTWLENHPDQVNSALRQRAPSSGQPSPVASERRPSPGQYDAPLFTPTGAEMYSSSQSQFVSGHGHNRGDTVSPRTTSFLPPTMTYEQPMFANGNSGPTFYPQARAAARGSAPGSHVFPQNEPGIFDIDFASMGMYDHMGGPNYQGR